MERPKITEGNLQSTGIAIRRYRMSHGITQARAAVRAGMDPSYWFRHERGRAPIDAAKLEKILSAIEAEAKIEEEVAKIRNQK